MTACFSDHLQIINMSLGSDYGPVDDPENDVVNELTANGVLTVNSIGNNGDLTDTGGAPGNAESTLAVASSVDAYQLRDGLKVNAPAGVAGHLARPDVGGLRLAEQRPDPRPGHRQRGQALRPATPTAATALTGADATAVVGKVAWLVWDSNDATRRCGSAGRAANVAAKGAVGAVFTGDVEPFSGGITGSAVIPVFQLTKVADREAPAGRGRAARSRSPSTAPCRGRSRTTARRSPTPSPASPRAARTGPWAS